MRDLVPILNCKFDRISDEEMHGWAVSFFRGSRRGYITTVNVAITMMMRSSQMLQDFVDRSALTVADGQPLVWLSRLLGDKLPGRVAGVDLVHTLSRSATAAGKTVYLMGARKEVVEKVAERLRKDIPGIEFAGIEDGYFTRQQFAERAERVRESGAGLLIVAMGVPRQEEFLAETWQQLGVQLAIGVGGSFDVISGHTRRAPSWMQKAGLEWFYRMSQEPRRLFKRYLVTNTQFIGLAAILLLSHYISNVGRTALQLFSRRKAGVQ